MTISWNDLKLFSRKELMQLVPKGFEFQTKPWTHQIAAFVSAISNQGFLCALDLGTGKTKVSIDYIRYLEHLDGNRGKEKTLVVCLNSAVENFEDEVGIHSNLKAVSLRGSKKEKWDLLKRKKNIYIINYEGLRSLLTKRVIKSAEQIIVPGAPEGEEIEIVTKNKQVLDPREVFRLCGMGIKNLIIDESHLIKSHESVNFKIAKELSKRMNNRLLMTGTPFGNTLLDVWSQYFIIDFGKTFTSNYFQFRKAFFKKIKWGWEIKPTGEDYIRERLYSKAIRYNEDEVDDLPPKIFREKRFNLSRDQRAEYDKLVNNEESNATSGVANKSMAYRQIASGFVIRSGHKFKSNPKLEALEDLIESVADRHKIVVFTEFTESLSTIEKMLRKNKIKFKSLSGKTKDKHAEYSAFEKDPSIRVLVANTASGGASINLVSATYCIHYELSGSVIQYKQSLKRIHRGGQTQKCFFYVMIAKNTVEASMYNNLRNGVDAFDRIVDFKKFLKGE